MTAVKTNEEVYIKVLEENNFLPNVFTLDGVKNLLELQIDRVPFILYKLKTTIREFEHLAYKEAEGYTTEEATDFINKSKTLETKLVLYMANNYLSEKFNFPVEYYNNGLYNLRDFLANRI